MTSYLGRLIDRLMPSSAPDDGAYSRAVPPPTADGPDGGAKPPTGIELREEIPFSTTPLGAPASETAVPARVSAGDAAEVIGASAPIDAPVMSRVQPATRELAPPFAEHGDRAARTTRAPTFLEPAGDRESVTIVRPIVYAARARGEPLASIPYLPPSTPIPYSPPPTPIPYSPPPPIPTGPSPAAITIEPRDETVTLTDTPRNIAPAPRILPTLRHPAIEPSLPADDSLPTPSHLDGQARTGRVLPPRVADVPSREWSDDTGHAVGSGPTLVIGTLRVDVIAAPASRAPASPPRRAAPSRPAPTRDISPRGAMIRFGLGQI